MVCCWSRLKAGSVDFFSCKGIGDKYFGFVHHSVPIFLAQLCTCARKQPCCWAALSRVGLSATPWTAARQAPLSMGFPRQEDCSALPSPPPGESSQLRDWTCVSCIGRWILYLGSNHPPHHQKKKKKKKSYKVARQTWLFSNQTLFINTDISISYNFLIFLILLPLWFFPTIKNVKPILSSLVVPKEVMGYIWLSGSDFKHLWLKT